MFLGDERKAAITRSAPEESSSEEVKVFIVRHKCILLAAAGCCSKTGLWLVGGTVTGLGAAKYYGYLDPTPVVNAEVPLVTEQEEDSGVVASWWPWWLHD